MAPHLLSKKFLEKWVRPKLPEYKGHTELEDHIHKFITNMEDLTSKKDLWFRMLRHSLKGDAIGWYKELGPQREHPQLQRSKEEIHLDL